MSEENLRDAVVGHARSKRKGAIPNIPSPPPPPPQKSNRELAIEAEIAAKKQARLAREAADKGLTDALHALQEAAAATMAHDFDDGLRLANHVKAMRVLHLQFKCGGQS